MSQVMTEAAIFLCLLSTSRVYQFFVRILLNFIKIWVEQSTMTLQLAKSELLRLEVCASE